MPTPTAPPRRLPPPPTPPPPLPPPPPPPPRRLPPRTPPPRRLPTRTTPPRAVRSRRSAGVCRAPRPDGDSVEEPIHQAMGAGTVGRCVLLGLGDEVGRGDAEPVE